ncbi:MAG: hypothetical protein Kow0040_01850 [Thermogutta sp.]
MRMVYVCKCCGKELYDADVRRLPEGAYVELEESELVRFRQRLQEVKNSGGENLKEVEDVVRAWRGEAAPSEDIFAKAIRGFRGGEQ